MNRWLRPLGFVAAIVVVSLAYFIGRAGRGAEDSDAGVAEIPDPGYAARDAVIIETGYDGRERYRLNAQVIRQQVETGNIDLEHLEMNYHPGAQGELPGQKSAPASDTGTWHLKSDRGQVRSGGDDVQLSGNVEVTGPATGADLPLTLTTQSLRVNTPTEFIMTDDPVKLRSSGNVLSAVGMEADLKAGSWSLKSQVHGSSTP